MKTLSILLVLVMCLTAKSDPTVQSKVVQPFCTDGCTGASSYNVEYFHCCIAHDLAYYRGGDFTDRDAADADLRYCAQLSGLTGWLSSLATMSTTAFGDDYWGKAWGNSRPSVYHDKLTPAEIQLLDQSNPELKKIEMDPKRSSALRYDGGYQHFIRKFTCEQ